MQASQEALDILNQLLFSKSVQDTIEVIKLFQLLSRYGIVSLDHGIRKILLLIFSSDEQIVGAVVDTYQAVFFESFFDASSKAQNLLKLMETATVTEVACVEELLKKLLERDVVDQELLGQLFKRFADRGALDGTHQRSAIQLVRMVSQHRPLMVLKLKESIIQTALSFAKVEAPDFFLAKEAITIFDYIQQHKKITFDSASREEKSFIFTMIHTLSRCFGVQDLEWFCAAESIINCMFNLHSRNNPQYAKLMIEQLLAKLRVAPDLRPSPPLEIQYAQIFFVVG